MPGELGIWLFVAGDLIVFSVFFVLIALGHVQQPEVFAQSLDMGVRLATAGIIIVAFIKVWIVGFQFMELRHAPRHWHLQA